MADHRHKTEGRMFRRIRHGLSLATAAWSLLSTVSLHAQQPMPLTIDEAVQTALSRNLNVRQAMAQVDAAGFRLRGMRANRLPEVDATVEYRRITSPPEINIPSTAPGIPMENIVIASEENTIGTIIARQELYTGGRVPALISRSEALFDVAVGSLGTTRAQVALATREAYYGVLLARSLVQSAEKSLAAAREQLAAATARFEAGTAARFDILRAETQVSEAEQELVEARNQLETSSVALNRILGVPLEQGFDLAEPGAAPLPEERLPALIAVAEAQRAELLTARARVAAAESGIRLAESERRPQVGLTAEYQLVAEETPAVTTGWTFIASASMEIFDGGRTRANIAEARALRDEVRLNLEETARAVEQDVRDAYLDLLTARQTLDTARVRLAQAEEAYNVALVRYEAGVGTAVELADALATLSAARTNLDLARFNYNAAYARLQRALGRE